MRKLTLALLLLSSTAYASESTLVLMDNTTIKTVHHYGNAQMEMETGNWEDVAQIQSSSFGDAECFDNARKMPSRQARMKSIDECLESDNTVAIGGLA